MSRDALERLFEDANRSSTEFPPNYSIDEQLDIEDDSFIDMMSESSKDALLSKIQKVELDEDKQFEENEEDSKEEPVVEEPKRGRGRPRKDATLQENDLKNNVTEIKSLDVFMDSLAKDLILELKRSNYTTRNFSKDQMLVILNYLEQKI